MPCFFSLLWSWKPKHDTQRLGKHATGGDHHHTTPALSSKAQLNREHKRCSSEPNCQAMGDRKPSQSFNPASLNKKLKQNKQLQPLKGKPLQTPEGGNNEKVNDADAQLILPAQVQRIVHMELAGIKEVISYHFLEMERGIHNYLANLELEQMVAELQKHLDHNLMVERNLQEEVEPQLSVVESGSFEEGTPTPPLLQEALYATQSALLTCAAKIAKSTKANRPKSKEGQVQAIFHQQLCYCFFRNFESSSFGGSPFDAQSQLIFRRPDEDLKHRLYKEFTDYQAVSVGNLFARQQTCFKSFWKSRLDMFVLQQPKAPFLTSELRQSVLENLLCDDQRCALFGDFARLAKTVWLLHKLAFAFEPTAQIFRVSEGMHFDAEYMESRDGEVDAAEYGTAAEVALMMAPGFTVRNFVLKAQVQLRSNEA